MPLAFALRWSLGAAAALLAIAAAVAAIASAATAHAGPAYAAATCADYPNQAAAQRAADTRDPDGDGLYCESLPCPCAGQNAPTPPAPTSSAPSNSGCTRPGSVQNISFSKTKYPNVRRHFRAAIRKGWPRT